MFTKIVIKIITNNSNVANCSDSNASISDATEIANKVMINTV